MNLRAWVNPLLAGLGIWLVYQIGKKTLGETIHRNFIENKLLELERYMSYITDYEINEYLPKL